MVNCLLYLLVTELNWMFGCGIAVIGSLVILQNEA